MNTKLSSPVYVVTRQGRRVEPSNYDNKRHAWFMANRIRNYLRDFDDPFSHKVTVIKTHTPWRIR